jgi:hypothetical protein
VEERFVELVAPYAADGVDVAAGLTAHERTNLHVYGHEFGRGATVDGAKLHCPWHHCIRSCVNACAIGLSRRPADTGSTTGSGSI